MAKRRNLPGLMWREDQLAYLLKMGSHVPLIQVQLKQLWVDHNPPASIPLDITFDNHYEQFTHTMFDSMNLMSSMGLLKNLESPTRRRFEIFSELLDAFLRYKEPHWYNIWEIRDFSEESVLAHRAIVPRGPILIGGAGVMRRVRLYQDKSTYPEFRLELMGYDGKRAADQEHVFNALQSKNPKDSTFIKAWNAFNDYDPNLSYNLRSSPNIHAAFGLAQLSALVTRVANHLNARGWTI